VSTLSRGAVVTPEEPVTGPAGALSRYRATGSQRGAAVGDTTRAIREAILDGALPAGAWLREQTVSAELGVSRTPVREALNRLEEEGLVKRDPGMGARVTALTIEDMAVVYQVRGSLESIAAQVFAEKASANDRTSLRTLQADLERAARADEPELFSEINIRFHNQLAITAQNAYLSRLLGTVQTAVRRFGTRTYSVERMHQILGEHQAIVEAITRKDGAAAAMAAAVHADSARSATLERFFGNS